MICQILYHADSIIRIPGKNRKPTKISECIYDMHAYWRLGDYLIKQIENSFEDVSLVSLISCCSCMNC